MKTDAQLLIRDLRAYLRRRGDDRPMPEQLRYVEVVAPDPERDLPGLRVGLAASPHDPEARRIRREGWPWCTWLGNRTRIAQDEFLSAVFASWTAERDPELWRQACAEARSEHGAEALLHRLRDEGHRLLKAGRLRELRRMAGHREQPGPKLKPSGGRLQHLFAPRL